MSHGADPEDVESLVDEIDGNERHAYSFSTDLIKTIDDLVRVCKIDLDEWVITSPEVRAWPVGMKLKQGDGSDKPIVVQLYYVSTGRMLRKHPQPVEPVIQPVEIRIKATRKTAPVSKGVKRGLLIADPQVGFRRRLHTADLVPFHDRRVLDIAMQILNSETFDDVFLVGDGLDLSEWSTKYAPEPEFFWTTQPALLELAWWLGQYRQAQPHARIMYFQGNHDARPDIAISTHMRAAYKLKAVDELHLPPALSIPRLLGLHHIDVEYVDGYPDNRVWINNNAALEHGDIVRTGPGATARAFVDRKNYTGIFAHIHRREMVSKKMMTSEGHAIITAFCPGCACHIDGRVPGSKSDAQWQQGLAVIEYTDELENIIPVAIDNGVAIYKSGVLTAADRDEEINAMLQKALSELGDIK